MADIESLETCSTCSDSGFARGVTYTQDEVAALFGVSRGRIQQIEKRAIQKLRKAFEELGDDIEDMIDL